MQVPSLEPGDMIALRADPQKWGLVRRCAWRSVEFECEVMINGSVQWVAESNLILISPPELPDWKSNGNDLLRELALTKLDNPLTESLYAYRASRTQHEPYQFRPALKFLRANRNGILIADEVGLGKTIEAAIIYLELKARLDIQRVLILCPSRLTGKWQDELLHRFEEQFDILDAPKINSLADEFERYGTSVRFRAIASFELFRRRDLAERWDSLHVPLDLLIVDEAHYLRNAETQTYKLGVALSNAADAVVMLSATPLHLRSRDLYNLLHLISPEEFFDPNRFEETIAPNAFINEAIAHIAQLEPIRAFEALRKVEQTTLRQQFIGNPFYKETRSKLIAAGRKLTQAQAVGIQRELIELNTIAPVFSRTRKREVVAGAVREPHTIRIEFSAEERALYNAVLGKTQERLAVSGSGAVGFAAIMQERQAASCLPALAAGLKEPRLGTDLVLQVELSEFDEADQDSRIMAESSVSLDRAARAISQRDTKFDQFVQILESAVRAHPESKALVFSFFRGTLSYLERRLRERGWRVSSIHGGVKMNDRRRIIEEFRDDSERQVLLSSEVGAEGLDFQFCDVLINYDLPWNPMQVEQRIGRLDRFGQLHEKIRIYNFHIADTIETRIFERLYQRIQLFESTIGDLDEILGTVISELTKAALQPNLTPRQQEQLAIDAATRILRQQQEAAALDAHRDQFLGQGAILDRQIEDVIESGQCVSQAEVSALVMSFLAERFPLSRIVEDAHEPCATLEMDKTLREYMTSFMVTNRLVPRASMQFKAALGNQHRLAFTFDSELARTRPLLDFVTLRHPLGEAALQHMRSKRNDGIPAARIGIVGSDEERGTGYFFVYLLEVTSARPRTSLESVIVMDDGRFAEQASECLLRALQNGLSPPAWLEYSKEGFQDAKQQADHFIAERRRAIEQEASNRNEAILAARTAAVRTSFDAKIRRSLEIGAAAADARIKRMKEGEARSLESRKEAKIKELGKLKEVAVSWRLVIAGRIYIGQDADVSVGRSSLLGNSWMQG